MFLLEILLTYLSLVLPLLLAVAFFYSLWTNYPSVSSTPTRSQCSRFLWTFSSISRWIKTFCKRKYYTSKC